MEYETKHIHTKKPLQDRFESLIMPEPNSGCWLWLGGNIRDGYGLFWLGPHCPPNPIQIPAHRASWIIYHGGIPDGLFVLHKCDVPLCVNPRHLFLGTQYENRHDCIKKGRWRYASGEHQGSHKLTETDVIRIRDDPASANELGDFYGVHPETIRKIRRNIRWKHLL